MRCKEADCIFYLRECTVRLAVRTHREYAVIFNQYGTVGGTNQIGEADSFYEFSS